MTLSFIGSWGERRETEVESARRMQRSWEAFPQEQGSYTPWSLREWNSDDVLQLRPVAAGDLDAIVVGIRLVTERINEGPRTTPGCYLEFVREQLTSPALDGDVLYKYDARCGFAGPRSVRNHVFLGLDLSAEDVVRGYLTALARAWEPEYVSVCTYAFHQAQRHKKPQQVRVGWLTYIRDDVPLDEGAVPAQVRIEAGDGGRYLTLSGTPWEPDLDEALAIRGALGYG